MDFLFSSVTVFFSRIIHSFWNSPYFKMVDVRRTTILTTTNSKLLLFHKSLQYTIYNPVILNCVPNNFGSSSKHLLWFCYLICVIYSFSIESVFASLKIMYHRPISIGSIVWVNGMIFYFPIDENSERNV